jgi:hypothetical protein
MRQKSFSEGSSKKESMESTLDEEQKRKHQGTGVIWKKFHPHIILTNSSVSVSIFIFLSITPISTHRIREYEEKGRKGTIQQVTYTNYFFHNG